MSLVAAEKSLAAPSLNLPSTADFGNVKLNNCDNAHIGTKVNINGGGGVILNQIVNVGDSKLDLRKLKEELNLATDSAIPEGWKQILLKFKYLWMSVILAMVVLVVAGCLFLFPSKKMVNDVDLPYNYTLRLRTRPEWFSKPELNCKDLPIRPAKFVIVGQAGSTSCNKPQFCEHIIKALQNHALQMNHCDISYNFLIAGDGYIYEGIGWGKYGSHTFGFNCDSIGVAFLGNYDILDLTASMIQAFNLLIEEGLKLKEIDSNYKLFAQNQVNARSPAENLINEVKKWKGWSEASLNDRLCD